MDGEESVSQKTEVVNHKHNSSKENQRIDTKGSCLKIEGKDGYVFKSYRVTPQDVLEAEPHTSPSGILEKISPLVSLSLEGTEEDLSSEVEGLSTEDSNAESLEDHDSQTSPAFCNKSQHTESASSEMEKSVCIKPEPNEPGENSQEDEKLIFDGAFGPFATKGYEEDYGSLFSGYSSTLYDVAMDAVTQSLLTSIRSPLNPRKKSPAWKHFFISPRDSTKAICMYCMKEFSRGKNEKDLSTSCLMRHVRRAHPTVLLQDCDSLNHLSNTSSLTAPNNEDLPASIKPSSDNQTLLSSDLEEATDLAPKDSLHTFKPKAEKGVKNDSNATPSPHSFHNHNEDASDLGAERTGSVPKSSNSRRRSAVWKHFYLSPSDSSKAVCIHCMNEFSRGKNGKDLGTSCLIRHMWRAHRDIVIDENGQGSNIPPPYTTPPTLLSSTQDSTDVKLEFHCTSDHPDVMLDNDDENPTIEEEADVAAQEPSLDGSFRLKGESTGLSFSLEEHSMSQDQSSVFQQNKKIMKRVKSEVWHHFIVSPVDQLKALCRYCPCVISRGKRGDFGTSCLMRHLMRRHPDVLQTQKSTGDKVSSLQSPHSDPAADDTLTSNAINSLTAENKPHTLPVFSKKTSKLWNHFSISSADPTKVVCLHCKRTISRGKKTTNLGTSCLFRHMQRFHGHVLENKGNTSGDVTPAKIQVKQEHMNISAFKENAEKFSECHPDAVKITKLVAEMLALDLHPSTLVENVGLNRLLEYLQPQYSLPSSSYFTSTAIPEMYESVKEVVLTHLKEAEGGIVHFTTSVWVSSQTQEYLILTAHWVSFESQVLPQGQDFHSSALLGIASIDCDFNMLNIQKQLELLWDSWVGSSGLKIGFTVTDNQSIRSILESSGHTSMQCFGHNIDLIVNEAIKSQRMVQNLLSIARKVCERVHRSVKAKEKLVELQKAHQLPENQLVQDVPSKWKTSYFMLERLVEQKKAIDEMSTECSFRELISCDQWEVMQSVCNALKPFVVACREMSSRTATLGQVIPLIHILNRKIDMLFDETMGIDNMLKSLKEALVTRMSPTLHDPRYIWATMLDPRYKTSLFTEEEAEQCKHDLIQELEGARSISVEANSPLTNGCSELQPSPNTFASNKENLWALMDDIRQKIKQEEKPKSLELAVLEYLEEDILDQSCDPLDYWNLKKLLWPDLAKVAVRYVGCPPSIVPADTLVSTSSVKCAPNQSRPLLENLERLLFLKVNLPLIYFQY